MKKAHAAHAAIGCSAQSVVAIPDDQLSAITGMGVPLSALRYKLRPEPKPRTDIPAGPDGAMAVPHDGGRNPPSYWQTWERAEPPPRYQPPASSPGHR
jgi:hypothetical protein